MKKLFIIVVIGLVLFLLPLYAGQKETTLLYPPFGHTWGIHRGTDTKLDMLLGDVTDFDNPQGLAAVKLKAWDNLKDKDDDDEITCFGVNAGRGEILYNSSMKSLALYGREGSGIGEFEQPRGICATEDGDVYVADMGNHRIVHLQMPKKKLNWVETLGDTFFQKPFDVAAAPGGILYVSDAGRNSIVVLDTSGAIIDEWTGFSNPRGISITDTSQRWLAPPKKNLVYVVDSSGKRIVKLDRRNGKILQEINMPEIGYKDADLQYLAIDYKGNIYVPDRNRCQIHKFDIDLNYIVAVGECGAKDEQFDHPRGIAIWRRFGQVIISERSGAQYFWVGVDVHNFQISSDSENRIIKLEFLLTEYAYMKVHIKGKDVDRNLGKKRRLPIGQNDIELNIPNEIPGGEYKIEFTFEAMYSSKGYFTKEITKKKVKL